MSDGLKAVWGVVEEAFYPTEVSERWDSEIDATVLSFSVEGRHFAVRVSREFDTDWASGQVEVNLAELPDRLRNSKDGRALVRRSGIFSN
ncbi:MAG: hypothetical protein ACRD04_12180 [Terriglobales bacterium]